MELVKVKRWWWVALGALLACRSDAKRALVVGGNGRVGGSTVRWLLTFAREEALDLEVAIGGRSKRNFETSRVRIAAAAGVPGMAQSLVFAPCDLGDPRSLDAALADVDVCVHTAGPFQSVTQPALLEACVRCGVPYVDVCDNSELARTGRTRLDEPARAKGIAAVVAAGIWPGVSALMAAKASDLAQAGDPTALVDLDLNFHTAGTGNAGNAIVAATFHLLDEPCYCVRDAQATHLQPWTERREVEFGAGVGTRSIYLLDNPDVFTLHQSVLKGRVRSMSSRFGTAPQVWNDLFGAIALVPGSILRDRDLMAFSARFSEPIIRVVDALVGATNAMRIDARTDKRSVTLELVHPDLEDCVGLATAAFAWELLLGTVKPGVRYACELVGTEAGEAILKRSLRNGSWRELNVEH